MKREFKLLLVFESPDKFDNLIEKAVEGSNLIY